VTAVIRTRGLVKRYGRLRAVDGIDLDVRAGDVYGFLGANGSGKTTTVRMLLGLVLPTAGEVELLGERMPRAGRRVLPRVARWSRGRRTTGTCPGGRTSR
jgi:ABC-2 type transport system ATP-binding protein